MNTDPTRIYEISIVAGTLFVILISIVVPVARHVMIRLDERISNIAELQRDIRAEQQRCATAQHRMLKQLNALRSAITVAYVARGNGSDSETIKSQYRIAAELLRRIEIDDKDTPPDGKLMP